MVKIYPLPVEELKAVLNQYPNAEDFAWVQEEPANQGAWSFVALNLLEHLEGVRLRRISRPAAAAPAVGPARMHDAEQAACPWRRCRSRRVWQAERAGPLRSRPFSHMQRFRAGPRPGSEV